MTSLSDRKAYQAAYYRANRTSLVTKQAVNRALHVADKAEYDKTYRAENRDTRRTLKREAERRRRALKLNLTTEVFTDQDVLDLYGTDCHICHEPIDLNAPRLPRGGEGWERGLQIDHVVPLARGGTHTLGNCKPSHGICNLRKHAK